MIWLKIMGGILVVLSGGGLGLLSGADKLDPGKIWKETAENERAARSYMPEVH